MCFWVGVVDGFFDGRVYEFFGGFEFDLCFGIVGVYMDLYFIGICEDGDCGLVEMFVDGI